MDFFQTDSTLTINIYTKRKGLTKALVMVDTTKPKLRLVLRLPDTKEAFLLHLELAGEVVEGKTKLRVGASGKVEVELAKVVQERWPGLGRGLEGHLWCGPGQELEVVFRDWEVVRNTEVSHDMVEVVVRPPASLCVEVPPGHHLQARAQVEGEQVVRSYTPVVTLVRRPGEEGCVHLLVKVYPGGALTPLFSQLLPGDTLELSEPLGSFSPSLLADRSGLLLLAAGTGVTPILSLLPHLPSSPNTLMFFNKTEADIPWRQELDLLDTLHVVHVMSDQEDFQGPQGRVSEALLAPYIEALLAPPGPLVLVCGPPGFSREVRRILQKLGLGEEEVHVFEG